MLNKAVPKGPAHYGIRVVNSMREVSALAWDRLLDQQSMPTPFMRHAYLSALEQSASACEQTGWSLRVLLMEEDATLAAAAVLYIKPHSRGEYVFDHAWAHAYARHGLNYYPKAICAVPFTPVNGSRLLARSDEYRQQLAQAMVNWVQAEKLSSVHLLFASEQDLTAAQHAGMLVRHTVQFHWRNTNLPFKDFAEFLATFTQEKRKKIRQERRKVTDAGVHFVALQGSDITSEDWAFFYRCYERTYLEHGNLPYLRPAFFSQLAQNAPQDWLLFVARRNGQAIASSLIGLNVSCQNSPSSNKVAYGRYWGALERVDCLHFEACYYQPIEWCIQNGYHRFEGGAQGEHKLARALMPVTSHSAHWLAHPDFFDAVARYLNDESAGVDSYVQALEAHSPLKPSPG